MRDVFEETEWLGVMDHLPDDIAFIVGDYVATPYDKADWTAGRCVICRARHKNHVANLCNDHMRICVVCGQDAGLNRDRYICADCRPADGERRSLAAASRPPWIGTHSKSYWWRLIHRPLFPSSYMQGWRERCRQREAAARAATEELQGRIYMFYALEAMKTRRVSFMGMRDKLLRANDDINKLRTRLAAAGIRHDDVDARPVAPFF